ncbi:MAG: TonB-dependent receptor plug domain-containing protein [Lewinellaceae bacterium]|nr:TonB-dependent receptor plug domain-containing protein [Lewinellaceae bacterium]
MITKLPLFLLTLGLSSFLITTTDPGMQIREKLDAYHAQFPWEKAYLHTDKPQYTLGDTLWAAAYLADGRTHQPRTVSNVLYLELIDPNNTIRASRNLRIDSGHGPGEIAIQRDWPAGRYLLRAYTNFMRNGGNDYFYQREIDILDPAGVETLQATSTRIETLQATSLRPGERPGERPGAQPTALPTVRFFPEGGDLVAGLPAVVAFHATDAQETGLPIEGRIVDDQGQFVTVFKALRFGMGSFRFTPQTGRQYTAEITYQDRAFTVPLPRVQQQGYTLEIVPRGTQINLIVRTNRPEGLRGTTLIGHTRGLIFTTLNGPDEGQEFRATLTTDQLLEGVAQFTLFDGQSQPVCERLVFVEQPTREATLTVTANQKAFAKRQQVKLDLNLQSPDGTPLAGNLSMTVTDDGLVGWPTHGENIKTYLLLSSDLRGRIEQPGYYFNPSSAGRAQLLDLVMLTHGWRRFTWKNILSDDVSILQYLPENGFTIQGQILRAGSSNPVAATAWITPLISNSVFPDPFRTGEDGLFTAVGFQLMDTTNIMVQASVFKEKRTAKEDPNTIKLSGDRAVDIILKDVFPPRIERNGSYYLPWEDPELLKAFLEGQRTLATIDSAYQNLWEIDLDAIEIKAQSRKRNPFENAQRMYGVPDQRLVIDSVAGVQGFLGVFDYLRGRVAGLQVFGAFPNQYAVIRGSGSFTLSSEALIVLDGIVVDSDIANTISLQDVAFVDVLKGASASIYGARGANGVIAIYTKRGDEGVRQDPPGVLTFTHPGFYRVREFYSPDYSAPKPEHQKPDYRTTLFWAPTIQVNDSGKAQVSFFTADKATQYAVRVEGVTIDGRPVVGSATLTVDRE